MSNDLDRNLGHQVLIGSGAIGTCLRERHEGSGPVEALNLSHPDAVRSLHEAYQSAGSQILLTNTFAANPLVLEEAGLEAECESMNRAGVELARQAARGRCLVWASVGPLSLGLRQEDYDDRQLRGIYMNQCRGLVEADAVVLETFTALREAHAAIDVLAELAMPFILQIGSMGTGTTRWERIENFLQLAIRSGAIGVGANCQHPTEIRETAEYVTGRTNLPVTVSPNAGHPFIARGVVTYEFSPDDFLMAAQALLSLGVSVIGGCCGTGPEHIARISHLAGQAIRQRTSIEVRPSSLALEERIEKPRPNRVRDLMENRDFVISVEIRASREQTPREILSGATLLARAGADMFDVPDNPGATIGRDAMVVAADLQANLGLPAICHLTATQSNLLGLHSRIIGCGDIGLQGILAVTGDSPAMGDLAQTAKRVKDLRSSVELLRLVKSIGRGKAITGQDIVAPPNVCAGCSVGDSSPAQMKWLAKKLEAGAEFAFSQPVFGYEDFERLSEEVAALGIRLFPGILPLVSKRNAEFLSGGRIPGICVPPRVVAAFDHYRDKESQRRCGLDFAIELARRIAKTGQGIYLIMPFGKSAYKDAAEIVAAVRPSGSR